MLRCLLLRKQAWTQSPWIKPTTSWHHAQFWAMKPFYLEILIQLRLSFWDQNLMCKMPLQKQSKRAWTRSGPDAICD